MLHLVQRGGAWAGYGFTRASPLLAVPNITAHPSTASVPITVLLHMVRCSAVLMWRLYIGNDSRIVFIDFSTMCPKATSRWGEVRSTCECYRWINYVIVTTLSGVGYALGHGWSRLVQW